MALRQIWRFLFSSGILESCQMCIRDSSMTDKDRMDVVDDCYASMRRYRNLVNYYTKRNIAVSFLRAGKKDVYKRQAFLQCVQTEILLVVRRISLRSSACPSCQFFLHAFLLLGCFAFSVRFSDFGGKSPDR